ncbi:MAG: PqqD family peptide modification chaperone [Solobacterium sp.]|nr:PqqD family peptide modification chaperone [Solobacterium sp.]
MIFKARPGVILTSVCDRYYLVTAKSRTELNETAVFCWKQLEKGCSTEQLQKAVLEEYETGEAEETDQEISELISRLYKNRLIIKAEE